MKTPLGQRTSLEYHLFYPQVHGIGNLTTLEFAPKWSRSELPTMKHWRIGEESLHDSTRSPYGVETIYMSLSTFPIGLWEISSRSWVWCWSVPPAIRFVVIVKCDEDGSLKFSNERLIGHTFFTLTKQRVSMKLRWIWVYYFDFDFPNWTHYSMHSLVPKPFDIKS